VLSFGLQFVAARLLGASEYGWANYLLGYALTISTFTYFGVQLYLPKELQVSVDQNKTLSATFWTNSLIYLAALPLLWLILGRFVTAWDAVYILTIAYLTLISEMMAAFYVGIGQAGAGAFIRRFLFSLLNVLVFFGMLLAGWKSGSIYLLAMIVAHVIINIPLFFRRLKAPEFRFAVLKRSLKFYLIQIVYGLYTGLSRVLQGIFGTVESVAVLSVGLLLSNIAIMMGDNFAKVVMPYFSKAWAEAARDKIREAYYEVTRFNAYLILPVVLFAMVNAPKILSLLGPEYATGVLVLNMLLFSQFFSTLVGPNGTLLSMTDKEKYEILNGTVKLTLALILGFALGPRYSWGIAFSIAAADVLVNVLKTVEVKKLFGFWPHKPKVFLFLVILTLTEVAGFWLLGKIDNLLIFVSVNGLLGLIIYFLSFYFSPEQKDRATLLRVIRGFSFIKPKP